MEICIDMGFQADPTKISFDCPTTHLLKAIISNIIKFYDFTIIDSYDSKNKKVLVFEIKNQGTFDFNNLIKVISRVEKTLNHEKRKTIKLSKFQSTYIGQLLGDKGFTVLYVRNLTF